MGERHGSRHTTSYHIYRQMAEGGGQMLMLSLLSPFSPVLFRPWDGATHIWDGASHP